MLLRLLAASVLLAAATCARAEMFSYTNPLPFSYESHGKERTEVRDPCVIHEGGRYYAIFTMWPFANRDEKHLGDVDMGSSPGIRIYSSADLATWKDDGWLVKSSELPADCPYRHQFWAPEIHHFNGRFYLIFTASNWQAKTYGLQEGYYAFIGVANKVTGPYQHITKIPNGPCDTTLFADGKGGFYLAMPRRDILVQKVDLSALDQGVITRTGPEVKVVTSADDQPGATSPDYLEGPWVERIGTRYCLLYAELYKDDGYWTGVAYADSPLGPYTRDPERKVFFGGHLAVFDGPDKRKWVSYRRERANEGRGLMCVDPLDVDAQGRIRGRDTFHEQVTVTVGR